MRIGGGGQCPRYLVEVDRGKSPKMGRNSGARVRKFVPSCAQRCRVSCAVSRGEAASLHQCQKRQLSSSSELHWPYFGRSSKRRPPLGFRKAPLELAQKASPRASEQRRAGSMVLTPDQLCAMTNFCNRTLPTCSTATPTKNNPILNKYSPPQGPLERHSEITPTILGNSSPQDVWRDFQNPAGQFWTVLAQVGKIGAEFGQY